MSLEDRVEQLEYVLDRILEHIEITPEGVYVEVVEWEPGEAPHTGRFVNVLLPIAEPLASVLIGADDMQNRLTEDPELDGETGESEYVEDL